MIFSYFLFNLFLYFYLFENSVKTIRFVSLIHAILSSAGGILYLNNLISQETQQNIVNYSKGYIILDLLVYTLSRKLRHEIKITYFHHTLFFIGTQLYNSYPEIYSYAILSEISTIPLNLRFIYKDNLKAKNIYSIIFYITFFIFRIINILYIQIYLLEKQYLIQLLMTILYILNLYWFYLINIKLFKILGFIK